MKKAGEKAYDLVCLGGGPAGIACAMRSAQLGKKVCIVEKSRLGGNDLHGGAILKYLVHAAGMVYSDGMDSCQYGVKTEKLLRKNNLLHFSWRSLRRNIGNYLIGRETRLRKDLLDLGVEIVEGRGRFLSPTEIRVDRGEAGEATVEGKNILIATGGRFLRLDHPGLEFTSTIDKVLDQLVLPHKTVIMGNGYLASELANILNVFKRDVTMCFEDDVILPGYEPELAREVMEAMKKRGVAMCSNAILSNVQKLPSKVLRLMVIHAKYTQFSAETIVYAGGREANLQDLDLHKAGVGMSVEDRLVVNDLDETSARGIFALGDAARRPMLHPVATVAAKLLAERLFGNGANDKQAYKMDYSFVPSAALTDPPIVRCGASEQEAIEQFGKASVTMYRRSRYQYENAMNFKPFPLTVKVVCKREANGTERIIGMHAVGRKANEVIGGFSLALRKGLYKHDLERAFSVHPTVAEEFFNVFDPLE